MSKMTMAAFAAAALCVCGTAGAGKVDIPKEGKYAIDFCVVGHGKVLSVGDKFFAISCEVDALTRSTPPGGAFDRMGARCYGIVKNVDGTASHSGACELTDLDGDKWWMDVMRAAPDGGGGYYKAIGGTGKYEGISLQGEFRADNNFGSPAADVAFVGCNPNQGTYKLKWTRSRMARRRARRAGFPHPGGPATSGCRPEASPELGRDRIDRGQARQESLASAQ